MNVITDGISKDIKSLTLQVTEKTTVSDLVKMSVDIFNETFERENSLLRMKTDYKIYKVKPSKKSGKPDNDLPSKFI